MALFIDTFVNKVDRKGRVRPGDLPRGRAGSGRQSFTASSRFPSFKYRAVQCAGIDWMVGARRARCRQVDLFSDEHDDLTATLFRRCQAARRSTAKDASCCRRASPKHAGITEIAAFVGRGSIFEIWEPKRFEPYKAEARQRARSSGRTLRQAPATSGGPA